MGVCAYTYTLVETHANGYKKYIVNYMQKFEVIDLCVVNVMYG